MTKVKYVGHEFSKAGLKPSPDHIKAIIGMPIPKCKEDVQRFNAMVGYLQKFLPKLSQTNKILRQLCENNTEFHWDNRHQEAYDQIKKMVTQSPVLRFYDVDKPVTLQTDASKHGIAGVLMQEQQPVAYASKALDKAQTNYAVIEKEMLAMVYACRKFHDYIYGKDIIIQTDHKPLLGIMNKPISTVSARMQRMRLKLQRYNVQLTYVPGKEMFLADTLSRAFLSDTSPHDLIDEEIEVNTVQMSDEMQEELQQATKEERSMQLLMSTIQNGWPDAIRHVPTEIKSYFTIQDEITCDNNLLFKGKRLIVPTKLRPEMIKRIHESHMGIVKSIALAKEYLYWPGMAAQIQNAVESCSACQTHQKAQQREPMISHEIPDVPWEKISADLFKFRGNYYLLCVDYYSKYPDINLLPDTSSHTTIAAMKATFSRFGIPSSCVSDSGPQFDSGEFEEFASKWGFKHIPISPTYSQSNGQVERTVQTVKNLMKKCETAGDDPTIALLNYRNTPLEGIGKSPAQLLMSRRLKSRLPSKTELLRPEATDTVIEKLRQRQQTQKFYYDRRAGADKPSLRAGAHVRFRDPKGDEWRLGRISQAKGNTPRNYRIVAENGRTFSRNRNHIRPTVERLVIRERPAPDPVLSHAEPIIYNMQPQHAPTPNESPPVPQSRASPAPSIMRAPQSPTPSPTISQPATTTRCGRQVFRPQKLDL